MAFINYFPVNSFVKKECLKEHEYVLDFSLRDILLLGSNYTMPLKVDVFRVCKVKDCKYVMKTNYYGESKERRGNVRNLDKYSPETISSEIKILKEISNKLPHLTGIYKNHWDCKKSVYIVMEHIKGKTFNNYKNINKELIQQIIDKLAEIHDIGIIHGDLDNPDNIIIDNEGSVKIIDFGRSTYIEDLFVRRGGNREEAILGKIDSDYNRFVSSFYRMNKITKEKKAELSDIAFDLYQKQMRRLRGWSTPSPSNSSNSSNNSK